MSRRWPCFLTLNSGGKWVSREESGGGSGGRIKAGRLCCLHALFFHFKGILVAPVHCLKLTVGLVIFRIRRLRCV